MAELLVSFHGGGSTGSINNLVVFLDAGQLYDLLSPGDAKLSELRKFLFSPNGDYLYVANGSKKLDEVLGFKPPPQVGGQWQYDTVYASEQVSHPFDLVFGFDGALFVSNQDSNQVTSYAAAGDSGTVFTGGYKAVRGLAYDGTNLFVADSGGDYVYSYGADRTQNAEVAVEQPVHLLYDPTSKWLLMGSESGNSVLAWDPADPSQGAITVVSDTNPAIDHTAGLALARTAPSQATLYVASRVGQEVLSFPIDFSAGKPVPDGTPATALDRQQLTDQPEFVGIQGGLYG